MIYDNILETIANTPVIKIQKLAPVGIDIYVKVESFNPMGSVKDRLALGIILDAEKRGVLKPGQTVIEATSGNTGIAMVGGVSLIFELLCHEPAMLCGQSFGSPDHTGGAFGCRRQNQRGTHETHQPAPLYRE